MVGMGSFSLLGRLAALLALVTLAACADHSVVHRGRVARPALMAPPKPRVMPSSESFRMCAARLDAAQVRYMPLPNEDKGGGCRIVDAIKLMDFGTPTANLGAMTCPLAATFAAWARNAVVPAARVYLGTEVVRIETFGTYACRDVRGAGGTIAGKLSEHAHANAVDVSAFVLADGRRVSVQGDWRVDGPTSEFLHRIHDSACKRFPTVLSPDYNAAHHDHFHLDMGGKGGFCR
ncbi:extensin family protein [Sphingobium nicotianae]|uniref:Extensin family protein n=1 Tax=Sphingobium nicotianae TaxID=2782607 RepID=A0A9X1DEI5_9SPHN|nr:extensin family protein [Sphingobium nicotianae]MBT2188740.1 extensin family protein [Sphingobium nicotianae]